MRWSVVSGGRFCVADGRKHPRLNKAKGVNRG